MKNKFLLKVPSLVENKIRPQADAEVEKLCAESKRHLTKFKYETVRADMAEMVLFYASRGWGIPPKLAEALRFLCPYPNRPPKPGVPEAIAAAQDALSETWTGETITDYHAQKAARPRLDRERSRDTYRRHLPEIEAEVLARRSSDISEKIDAGHTKDRKARAKAVRKRNEKHGVKLSDKKPF